jgi:MFS family permease
MIASETTDYDNDNDEDHNLHLNYRVMEDSHTNPYATPERLPMTTRRKEQALMQMMLEIDSAKRSKLMNSNFRNCSIDSNSDFGFTHNLKKTVTSSFFFDKYTRTPNRLRVRSLNMNHTWSNILPIPINMDTQSHANIHANYPHSPGNTCASIRSSDEVQQYEYDSKVTASSAHDPYLDFVSKFYPKVYDYAPLTAEDMKEGFVPEWMFKIYSLPNLAIPMSYFCVGIALQLLRTPLIVYFIQDMDASASDVNVLFTVMAVPWCFKVFYGLLSDCMPIGGQRRKPYFFVGWLVYVMSNIVLAVTPKPSIRMCILFVFFQTAGFMLADVMTDAFIVERSQYEPPDKKGTMQSQGYIIRFFGSVVGATVGASVFNKDLRWFLPINAIFFLNALFPVLFLVPIVPFLMEIETNSKPQNFFNQLHTLFETVQLKAVWRPMTFVYVYNALQLTNASWMNFLVEGLDFKAWMIGIVGIAGSLMSWCGIIVYEKYFFATSWRIVFFWCTALAAIISLGQVLLVFGINRKIGINDIYFSVGDDVLVEFVIAVQFLPMCIM